MLWSRYGVLKSIKFYDRLKVETTKCHETPIHRKKLFCVSTALWFLFIVFSFVKMFYRVEVSLVYATVTFSFSTWGKFMCENLYVSACFWAFVGWIND